MRVIIFLFVQGLGDVGLKSFPRLLPGSVVARVVRSTAWLEHVSGIDSLVPHDGDLFPNYLVYRAVLPVQKPAVSGGEVELAYVVRNLLRELLASDTPVVSVLVGV